MRKLVLLSMTILSACSNGWDKDPFAKDSNSIKKAVPQGTDQKGIPPEQNVTFLDLEPHYIIYEGEQITIPVSYRITHPEVTFQKISVKEVDDGLDSVHFDASKNEITVSTEFGDMPIGMPVHKIPLHITLTTEYKGLKQKTLASTTVFVIRGNEHAPVIEDVKDLPVALQEDAIDTVVKVYVRDRVSVAGPTLQIIADTNLATNASQFIENSRPAYSVPNDPTLWEFQIRIKMKGPRDITNGLTRFGFYLAAYTMYGVPSVAVRKAFDVYTLATTPSFYVDGTVNLKVNQANNIQFFVADMKREGKVAARFTSDCATTLGQGAVCECTSLNNSPFVSECTINWTPTEVGTKYLTIKASNTVEPGPAQFKDVKEAQHYLTIQVKN